MDGRVQREILIENKIEAMLSLQPEYIKDFYEWMNGKSVTTKESYVRYVVHFMKFCCEELGTQCVKTEDLDKISLRLVNKYMRSISVKTEDGEVVGYNGESIINTKICAISTFFRFLEYEGLVQQNPCSKVNRPTIQEKEEVIYLTPEEIEELMLNIDNGVGSSKMKAQQEQWKSRDKCLISLLLITGMRVSALTDINIEDIDPETRILQVVEKERKPRRFKLPEKQMDLIGCWLRDRDTLQEIHGGERKALFLTVYAGECKRITTKTINNLIKKYAATINKHITAHKLRATFAVTTYDKTGDIYLVSDILGHKSPEVTRRYIRVNEKKKEEAMRDMSEIITI